MITSALILTIWLSQDAKNLYTADTQNRYIW